MDKESHHHGPFGNFFIKNNGLYDVPDGPNGRDKVKYYGNNKRDMR